MSQFDNMGVCIKNLDKRVIYQNDLCIKLCGDKRDQKCFEGCMENYKALSAEGIIDVGVSKPLYCERSNEHIHSTVINDGNSLTTFFVLIADKLKNKLSYYQRLGLTKSEMGIISLKIKGLHNKEIAKKLFISLATLKTHLNNIYKKVSKSIINKEHI